MEETRPRVVITQRVHAEVIERLAASCSLDVNDGPDAWSAETLRARAAAADAMMAFMPDRVDRAFLAACPRLSIIAAALKGADNIDVGACTEAGVWLTIVPDLLTVPTAELAIGLMIGLARNVVEGDRLVRAGRFGGWRPMLYGTGLAGRTVGMVGMGAIGRAIAARLSGFEARLLYHDPRPLATKEAARLCVEPRSLEALFAESDYVVLAVPLTDTTVHLVDDARLACMNPGAFLINPGRGSLVDEAAVARALAEGRLGGYAADVFEFEDWARPGRPLGVAPGLLVSPRTLLTPHLGSATHEARRAIEIAAAESILDALQGRIPAGAINRPRPRAAAA